MDVLGRAQVSAVWQRLYDRTKVIRITYGANREREPAPVNTDRQSSSAQKRIVSVADKSPWPRIAKPSFAATSSALELVGLADKLAGRNAG